MADDSRKLFYSIGEVAEIFHVNESTLRFWEKEFPTVIKPKKNAKGTRNYTKDDIENIRLIHFLLKEKGMTLAGARKKLREEKKGMTAQHELTDRLKKIKSELLKLQTELGKSAQEAPEFADEPLISNRMVFAEPGSEMISVETILEEVPAPEEEHLPAPAHEPILEESPFAFDEVEIGPVDAEPTEFTYELEDPEPHMDDEIIEESSEFEAEEFTAKPEEKEAEMTDDSEARALYEELEPELIPQPKPESEPEPTPEQNLFYEQPENLEPPKPEPSNDGWSGSLF